MERSNERGWAEDEFGSSELGNRLRSERLVTMAATCAVRPAGKVTEVFSRSAEREAAFRFLENEHTDPEAMMNAAHEAGAKRCQGTPFAYVPIDQTSLNFKDPSGSKGLGMIGHRDQKGHGFVVMSAIAVTPDGTPHGLVAQKYWKRSRAKRASKRRLRRDRPIQEKETQHWLDVMAGARAALGEHAPGTRPWFQIDRAGDAWALLSAAASDQGAWFTTRAAWDRRLRTDDPRQRYLWETVYKREPLGSYAIDLQGTPHRKPRRALMALRATLVTLDMEDPHHRGKRIFQKLWAVLASEHGTVPSDEEPLEWMLLTTFPADSLEAASHVLLGYTQRWRVEEFHKAWKTGACNIEDSQLRDAEHLLPWAIILASVAMRILRMTYLARACPDARADLEFDAREIRAVVALVKPKHHRANAMPTINQMVTWIAELGGYTGKSSGGPPGALVIARGLDRLKLAVQLLSAVEKT